MSGPTLSTRFDPLSPEQRENPFDILASARRQQPVFHVAALDLWVVTRHDDVLAVLKDHETFSSTGALKSAAKPLPDEVATVLAQGYREMPYIIEIDPPLHDRIRGLVTKAFTPRRIAGISNRSSGGPSANSSTHCRPPARSTLSQPLRGRSRYAYSASCWASLARIWRVCMSGATTGS
jgi:hypothetical protein